MTLFGLDVSNHQSRDGFDAVRARDEGFAFVTHKINEGTWVDPFWARERDETWPVFPGRFGGYVFCRTNTSPLDELAVAADNARNAAGQLPPLQIDYEDTKNGGSLDDLLWRIDAALHFGFHLLPIYLPRWYWRGHMGAPDLSELPVGIWNSDYVPGRGYASALYPGDDYKGWADMGGQPVQILQFSETAIAAGENPCDANAFRGTPAELDALFGAGSEFDMAGEAQDVQVQLRGPDLNGWPQLGGKTLVDAVGDVRDQLGGPDHQWGGWPQLGGRTLVDAVAAIGEKLGIEGMGLQADAPEK
ncbi:metallopeptidase [Nocardia wallacei]|uniref:metallopeptidase n=1 Tax=Nocardia wallacei TaxID=480035 RepID=UPI002453847E|nr:metallopeptidase [Nocardia wallacei]